MGLRGAMPPGPSRAPRACTDRGPWPHPPSTQDMGREQSRQCFSKPFWVLPCSRSKRGWKRAIKGKAVPLPGLLSIVLNHCLSSPLPSIVVVYRSWPHERKRSMRSKAYEGVFDILLLHFKHKNPNCEPNQNTEKTHGNQIISNSRQLLLCKSLSTAVKLSPEAHQPLLSKLLTDLHLPRKRDSGYPSLHHPHSPQGFSARLLTASKREAHELQPALATSSMAPGSLWGSTKLREDEFQRDVLLSKFSHPEAWLSPVKQKKVTFTKRIHFKPAISAISDVRLLYL